MDEETGAAVVMDIIQVVGIFSTWGRTVEGRAAEEDREDIDDATDAGRDTEMADDEDGDDDGTSPGGGCCGCNC